MLVLVTVLFSDYISLRERATYQSYLNIIGAVGSTSGGPLGQSIFKCPFEERLLTW